MKRKILYMLIVALVFIITSCEFDNYTPPKSILTGTVNYLGTPVGVRSTGTQLELWQYGYQTRSKIAVYIDQDGTYSARLFDGNYKLVRLTGAPWPANATDSISVTVSGNTVVDVPVVPYFTISGQTFVYTAADSTITSTSSVTKVGTLNIASLTLYAGATTIVDANNNLQSNVLSAAALSDLTTPKTNKVKLSKASFITLNGKKYVYARLGVATSGVGERFYTTVVKLTIP
jgi:hypothetical protein